MEAAFQDVSSQCAPQMEAYTECVEANPSSFSTTCLPLQQQVAACSANASRAVALIRNQCRAQFNAYDLCVQNNMDSPDQCDDKLTAFFQCGDAILKARDSSLSTPAHSSSS